MKFVARTAVEPIAVQEAVRRKVKEVSATLPMQFTTMDARLADTGASPRFRGLLLGIFASLAVVLAMAGVYGGMAHMVSQRAGGIGVRLAFGAARGENLRLVMGGGDRPAE